MEDKLEGRNMRDVILPEEGYAEAMKSVVEPYVAERRTAAYCEREKGRTIFYVQCLADDPKGLVVISHGYTETAEKYLENIYYFLCAGYHVFMPEHCGHGRSYRMCSNEQEMSLVHIDRYERYVEDLLYVSRIAAKEYPKLPVYLYGHSMGGGIAAAAAAQEPGLFVRVVLSSPMIRPNCAPVPWPLACLIAKVCCMMGRQEQYLMGHHPYDGAERFEDSASISEARFNYYQEKRKEEPLFQMNAASYGWLWQTARLNHYLRTTAWRRIACPVLVFQAECDTTVSNKEQERFVRELSRRKDKAAKLVRVPKAKHEIFNSETRILKIYWRKLMGFLFA